MKTLKQVEAYANKVIPLINLSHWEIVLKKSTEDTCEIAMHSSLHNYKTADIYFYEEFWKKSKSEQEKIIIHELLHCHCGFWRTTLEILENSHDTTTNRIIDHKNSIVNAEEECVELLARSIYKLIKERK